MGSPTELEAHVARDKQVLGLDVAVDDPLEVQVLHLAAARRGAVENARRCRVSLTASGGAARSAPGIGPAPARFCTRTALDPARPTSVPQQPALTHREHEVAEESPRQAELFAELDLPAPAGQRNLRRKFPPLRGGAGPDLVEDLDARLHLDVLEYEIHLVCSCTCGRPCEVLVRTRPYRRSGALAL